MIEYGQRIGQNQKIERGQKVGHLRPQEMGCYLKIGRLRIGRQRHQRTGRQKNRVSLEDGALEDRASELTQGRVPETLDVRSLEVQVRAPETPEI